MGCMQRARGCWWIPRNGVHGPCPLHLLPRIFEVSLHIWGESSFSHSWDNVASTFDSNRTTVRQRDEHSVVTFLRLKPSFSGCRKSATLVLAEDIHLGRHLEDCLYTMP